MKRIDFIRKFGIGTALAPAIASVAMTSNDKPKTIFITLKDVGSEEEYEELDKELQVLHKKTGHTIVLLNEGDTVKIV